MFLTKHTAGTGKRGIYPWHGCPISKSSISPTRGEKRVTYNRKSNAVFLLFSRPGVLQFWLKHHSIRGKNWGNHCWLWLWWINDFQSFCWYPSLTGTLRRTLQTNNGKALFKHYYTAGFSLFNAWHCLSIVGGVKWRKLGIFINSALANLPGGVAPGTTQPWCKGSRTLAGWKHLAIGLTEGQSWSKARYVGTWTAALLYTLRP